MSQSMTFSAPYAPAPQRRRSSAAKISLVLSVVSAAAAITAAVMFLFGAGTLDDSKLQAEIVRITQQSAGLAPTDIHCPANVAIKAGDVATCTAQLDGQPITYTVRQNDDQGNVSIQSGLFVVTDKAEKTLTDSISKETGLPATADCAGGKHVVVGGRGTAFTCTATSTQDQNETVQYTATVTNDQGDVEFS